MLLIPFRKASMLRYWKKKKKYILMAQSRIRSQFRRVNVVSRKLAAETRACGYFQDSLYSSGRDSNRAIDRVYSRWMDRECRRLDWHARKNRGARYRLTANRRQFRMHPVEIGTLVLDVDGNLAKTLSACEFRPRRTSLLSSSRWTVVSSVSFASFSRILPKADNHNVHFSLTRINRGSPI